MTEQEIALAKAYRKKGFTTMAELAKAMPLWVRYETEINGKEGYNQIQAVFAEAKTAAEGMTFEEDSPELAAYMTALAQCGGLIDEEVFDHYKNLERDFKEVLHRLADPKCPGRLLGKIGDSQAAASIGRAILVACGSRMILKEKYQGLGEALAEGRTE